MATIQERLRRGPIAYATTHSRVYAGPTLQDTEAADVIDALVEALEQILAEIPPEPKTALAHVIKDIAIDALSRARGDIPAES